MAYMKDFMDDYEWWKLVPNFEATQDSYVKNIRDPRYSVATVENELYVGYFYSDTVPETVMAVFQHMKNADYEVVWMNCATGERTTHQIITVKNGTYKISPKPTADDWVIAVRLIEE
jgi:hypothetical protein